MRALCAHVRNGGRQPDSAATGAHRSRHLAEQPATERSRSHGCRLRATGKYCRVAQFAQKGSARSSEEEDEDSSELQVTANGNVHSFAKPAKKLAKVANEQEVKGGENDESDGEEDESSEYDGADDNFDPLSDNGQADEPPPIKPTPAERAADMYDSLLADLSPESAARAWSEEHEAYTATSQLAEAIQLDDATLAEVDRVCALGTGSTSAQQYKLRGWRVALLKHTGVSITKAAEMPGISPTTARRVVADLQNHLRAT